MTSHHQGEYVFPGRYEGPKGLLAMQMPEIYQQDNILAVVLALLDESL